ncbi:MAG: OmpA family protein [Alphaproteobacteria bacterium]
MKYLSQTQKLGILAVSAMVLSACGTSHVPQANETDFSGNDFNHELARNYREFSNFEAYEMHDWSDAILYADKALASANGNPPWPDDMKSRSIDGDTEKAELREARRRLVAALENGAARAAPKNTASAQSNFDCWVEQQEEGWQVADIAACKDGFYAAMAATDLAMAPEPVAKVEEPVVQVVKAAPTEPKLPTYLVFFDWDKSEITSEGSVIIDAFMKQVNGTGRTIQVSGYTDTSGSNAYNMKLSESRAESVKKLLVTHGVPADTITILSLGEDGEQLIATEDGVREARNRRVGVDLM